VREVTAKFAFVTFSRRLHLPLRGHMEVRIQHLGGVKFEASARGHHIICDQPASNGGSDEGMTPPEFLLASLGTCAAFYAAKYLEARKLPVESLQVRVTAEKATQPARLDRFRIEVFAPGLDPVHEAGILRAVKACLIHNTLLHTPDIETVVRTGHDTIGVRAELAETTRN
jgi:putative redox protein